MKLSSSSLRKAADIQQKIERLEAELEIILVSSRQADEGLPSIEIIVEDPEIQGGVPTFRGTRIPVYQISGLLQQGVSEKDLYEDYPHLTAEMIDAARIHVQARPRRWGPRKPKWRRTKPLTSKLIKRHGV